MKDTFSGDTTNPSIPAKTQVVYKDLDIGCTLEFDTEIGTNRNGLASCDL